MSYNQGRVAMVDHQSEVKQWEVPSDCDTTDNYSIKCISERLETFLSGSQNSGTFVKTGSKRTYKRFEIKCHTVIHKKFQNLKEV